MLYSIESHKWSTLRTCAHHDTLPLDMRKVEAVQRLPDTEQYEVGDVYNIIDRALTGGYKQIAQPFRRFCHFDATHRDACVSAAPFGVEHFHGNAAIRAVDGESILIRDSHLRKHCQSIVRIALFPKMGLQIAGTSVVAGGIHAVGSQFHFEAIVAFHFEIFCGRGAGSHILAKHHYSVVAFAESDFIFSANHAE